MLLPGLWTRLLFGYLLFLLGKNQDCYSNILSFYQTQFGTIVQISSIPTQPKTKTSIQISSISTWKKSGLLFICPLFLPDINRDCCLNILYSYPAYDQDSYSDILYFYLTQYKTAIQISFIYTWQKSGLLFKYPLFLPGLRPRLLLISSISN